MAPESRFARRNGLRPPRRKARRRVLVDRVVEVLRAVARRLDHDDAAVGGVADRGEVVRPPFDGDVAALVSALAKLKRGPGRCISRRMMSPAPSRVAAWLIAAG